MRIVLYVSGEVETMIFDKILLLKKNVMPFPPKLLGFFGYKYVVLGLQIKP